MSLHVNQQLKGKSVLPWRHNHADVTPYMRGKLTSCLHRLSDDFQSSVICMSVRTDTQCSRLHLHWYNRDPTCWSDFKSVFPQFTRCSYIDCALGCEPCQDTHECTAVLWLNKHEFIWFLLTKASQSIKNNSKEQQIKPYGSVWHKL